MIIEQAYNLLRTKYGDTIELLSVEDVRIGAFITAVRLSDGSTGTASSLQDEHPFCRKADRDFGEFTPLKMKGRKVSRLFEMKKNSAIISSLRTAALNAVSSGLVKNGKYRIVEDCDPVSLIDLDRKRTITMVGAFQSYIEKIAGTGNILHVLEMNESAFQPEHRKYYVPAADYAEVIPRSDVVVITGQTLVNNTIEPLLDEVKDGTEVILTGPSAGILPEVLFANGVTIIGTSRFTKPDLVLDIASQGGLGYHLFEYCAQKICILKG